MSKPLPCDPDDILSYEAVTDESGKRTSAITVIFKDGREDKYEGADAENLVAVLGHVTPPTA